MATDISKLGVKTKWQDLTEGMIVAGAGTSKDFHTGEWTQCKAGIILKTNVNSACYVYRSVRTVVSRLRI